VAAHGNALAAHLLPGEDPPALYFFARNGFARRLVVEAERDPRIHLIAAETLLSRWRRLPRVDPVALRADVDRLLDSGL
jgi:hypothetical protein